MFGSETFAIRNYIHYCWLSQQANLSCSSTQPNYWASWK